MKERGTGHPGRMKIVAGCLMLIPLGLWLAQVVRSGPSTDESGHIPAGVYHLLTGRMDAYRVNPPLPRMIAALPLLATPPQVEWRSAESPHTRIEFELASDWLLSDTSLFRRQLVLSRLTMFAFFLLGLISIVCWTKDLYGPRAAWLAAGLWSLNPDILTCSAVVMPDLPATSAGLLLGYRYWSWLVDESRKFPGGVAVCLALAVLCKFTWLFLFALLPIVTLVYDVCTRKPLKFSSARDACRLVGAFVITVLMINWCYGFDGTGTRLGDFEFISGSFSGETKLPPETGNRFRGQVLGSLPLPFPKEMIRGIDFLKWEFERGYPCYLNGTWQHRGWWYFYLVAMAVKMPLGYWMLIGMGILSFGVSIVRRTRVIKGEWLALLLGVALIASVSSQTGFTHHIRYVLPAYGFLFVVASRITIFLNPRRIIALSVLGLSGTIGFHALNLGLAHTFFNPLAGGPNEGWRYLSDSNVDHGQSTFRMLRWIESHPQVRPLRVQANRPDFEIFLDGIPNVSKSFYPVDYRDPAQRVGFLALSSATLTHQEYQFLWDVEPWARPYADVLVFRLDQINPSSQPDIKRKSE
jgi:hypothetical protein